MSSYTPINPVRLVDTRNNIGGVRTPIDRGCTMRVNVGADVPSNAQAVALSMTAVTDEADYFTVYPCASGRPETSNLNSRAGFATPNLVVAIPDANREICIFSHGRSHLILDLSGWWSDGPDRLSSISPERVYDSRRPGFAPLSRFQVREVQIPSNVVPDDATAAVVNLTAANAVRPGYMTVFPCGEPVPNASNVNFLGGEARAVGAIVGLGQGRTICVVADTTVHVIVDVSGYYAPAPGFGPTSAVQPSSGRRVVDTRNGIGGPLQPLAAGEVRAFDPVAGIATANDASAVMLNFVSTDAVARRLPDRIPLRWRGPGRVEPQLRRRRGRNESLDGRPRRRPEGLRRVVRADEPHRRRLRRDDRAERVARRTTVVRQADLAARSTRPRPTTSSSAAPGPARRTSTMSIDLLPVHVGDTLGRGGAADAGRHRDRHVPAAHRPAGRRVDDTPGCFTQLSLPVCADSTSPASRCSDRAIRRPAGTSRRPDSRSPNPALNGPYLMILDHYGAPVWYKRTPSCDDRLRSGCRMVAWPSPRRTAPSASTRIRATG